MSFNVPLFAPPNATIAGNCIHCAQVTAIDGSKQLFQAEYIMQQSDPEGLVLFLIEFMDAAGNVGSFGVETLVSSNVTFGKPI
jgi:hypothetical protein